MAMAKIFGFERGRMMSCIFFRRFLNILFLAVIALWASGQPQSQGQTISSTGTSGTTASDSTQKTTSGSAAPLKVPKKAKKLKDQAKKALDKGDLKKAETLLNSAIAEYPDYYDAWMKLNVVYQKQNYYAHARDAVKKAIAIDGLNADPYVQLGWIEIHEKHYPDAVKAAQKAVELAPLACLEGYYINALANSKQSEWIRAEKSARSLIKIDSKHLFPQVHLILALIKAVDKDYESAINECRKYLKYAPNAADAEEVRIKIQEYEKQAKPDSPK
jgi:tetratricopeptide (TPR) repeat protein